MKKMIEGIFSNFCFYMGYIMSTSMINQSLNYSQLV
jgi:hypothetical protein